jgi:hypothetical protein
MAIRIRLGRSRLAFWRLVILFCLVLPVTLHVFLACIVPVSPALIPVSLLLAKHPVLIVAHPDDESLFFGPTILALNRAGVKKELRILVLSSGTSIAWVQSGALTAVGNNYGLGETRKMELKAACLRIGAKQCMVLDREDIKDNPKTWWDQEVIQTVTKSWISKWNADAVCLRAALRSVSHQFLRLSRLTPAVSVAISTIAPRVRQLCELENLPLQRRANHRQPPGRNQSDLSPYLHPPYGSDLLPSKKIYRYRRSSSDIPPLRIPHRSGNAVHSTSIRLVEPG